MKAPKIRAGGWAWLGLTGYVTLSDAALIRGGKPTMSRVFGDSLEHPVRRWPVMVVWGALTVHLFSNVFPVRARKALRVVDPIHYIARALGEVGE